MKFFFNLFILLLVLKSTLAQSQSIITINTDDGAKPNDLLLLINRKPVEMKNQQFSLPSSPNSNRIQLSAKGYQSVDTMIQMAGLTSINIMLLSYSKSLDAITITGNRFGKKAEENTSSIEVLKPAMLKQTGIISMEDAVNRVPGVDVIENQVNIRGGAGWSFGAGSRVLVLQDDIPMLTADANDVKWNFLPIENCEQVEVLKGAASGVYGSSALNGVINFRTAFAKNKPVTKAQIYSGLYSAPQDKSWKWWGNKTPNFQGGYFSHAQKVGQWDLVLGTALFKNASYLQGETENRYRINGNINHRGSKYQGLRYGLNFNWQQSNSSTFLFWGKPNDSTTQYLQPYGGLHDSSSTISKTLGQRLMLDPYIIYTSKNGTRHSLKNRFFRSVNDVPTSNDRSSTADLIYSEYQWHKTFGEDQSLYLFAGVVNMLQFVKGDFYGNHTAQNQAVYIQAEKKLHSTWYSLSARLESNQLDKLARESRPVFRLGINHALAPGTHIKASWGQGYRYPSIAERFVATSFGASKVLPNPDLTSETGWSADLGIKQVFKNKNNVILMDFSLFWMQYSGMMEFNFGLHLPKDSTAQQLVTRVFDYIGFKSINVGQSKIYGADLSITSKSQWRKMEFFQIFGYTYMNPTYINPDSAIKVNLSDVTSPALLKYRFQHSIKYSIDISRGKWGAGLTLLYNDFMKNIDEVLANTKPDENLYGFLFDRGTHGLSSSINAFRQNQKNGTMILDARLSYQIARSFRLAFIVKNLTNRSYMTRPGLISPLRNYTLQLSWDI